MDTQRLWWNVTKYIFSYIVKSSTYLFFTLYFLLNMVVLNMINSRIKG